MKIKCICLPAGRQVALLINIIGEDLGKNSDTCLITYTYENSTFKRKYF